MPFVTDIVGPQRPVHAWPPLVAGAVRRTSTIDTHPAGTGESEVDLRARDVVARDPDMADVLGEVCVRAHLTDRVVDDIASHPHDTRLVQLLGSRVGPGFRATVNKLLPDEAERASLLHLLLDDWVGAALVSGYALQHVAITLGIEEKLPPGTADNMAGICAGFASDASLVPYARRNGTIPSVHGPVAPRSSRPGCTPRTAARPWHASVPTARPGTGRCRVRLSSAPTSVTPTLTATASRRSCTSTPSSARWTLSTRTIESVRANVQVLPWQECPGAIGSAARVRGHDAVGDARSDPR